MTNTTEITFKLECFIYMFHSKTLRYHYYYSISSCNYLTRMDYDHISVRILNILRLFPLKIQ